MFKLRHVIIWSSNPDELMKFYRDTLGFELLSEGKLEDDYGYEFSFGEENTAKLWIGRHSEVNGKLDKIRTTFDLWTENVQEWYEKVKVVGCEIVAEPFISPDSSDHNPRWVCTWLDPEGNY